MKKLLRKDLLSMGFYEKSRFTGSIGHMNYILEKSQKEGEAPLLLATYFPGPFSSENTPDEKKETHTEAYSEQGFLDMTDFLNTEAEKFNEESFEQL